MSGWIAISRDIHSHPVFHGRPDRLYAWTWMLAQAAWKNTRFNVSGEVIEVKRGNFCASQATMCAETGMSRQALRTFFTALKNEGAIKTQSATKLTKSATIVTICNYDKYQSPQPSANQAATKQQPTKEQDNNIPVGADEKSPAADPTKIMFDAGRKLLTESGRSSVESGKLLGMWRNKYGDANLIAALGRAQRENALDPVGFITGALKFSQKQNQQERPGHVASGAFGNIPERC